MISITASEWAAVIGFFGVLLVAGVVGGLAAVLLLTKRPVAIQTGPEGNAGSGTRRE